MKSLIGLCTLFLLSLSLFAQQTDEEEYMEKWKEYKEEKAPFNQNVERGNFLFQLEDNKQELHLGDLRYKKKQQSLAYDAMSVALWLVSAVDENLRYQKEIHKDPARFFAIGYGEHKY